ncbi:SRPBCC family protein [Dietzia kunjamensis]|uniref:SRPBCC family protein n=1 Tax=Dietzia kunjamensis TaxID=322509 RepID=UPI0022B4E8CA|nr:SRPBCC family protein [Dietzia kunjamensis]MCZ4655315.1 SRPBCC family protein [Dietzia kunjamensis]MDJ0422963.1 SRPBCC family protein [Dietzia kunjamensis]
MPVTSVDRDLDRLTLTITAEFPVPVRRLWDEYVDPRQLEKFWGPPTWPATFTRHDVFPGGRSDYYMTGPDGSRACGYWEYLSVDECRSFEVLDGFSHDDGRPNTDLPTREAMGQIEAVVTDDATFAADTGTQSQLLDERTVRVTRILHGTPRQVWDAHHEPELLNRWFHGPDGWALVGCRVAPAPGETTRFEWAPDDGVEGEAFALTGQLLETDPPHREVFTETMEGVDAPPTRNEQTLTAVEGGTLLTLVITYDSADLRETILGTGMVDGMEAGYRRLEAEVLTSP